MAFTMWLILTLCGLILLNMIKYIYTRRRLYILSWKLPGPIGVPLLGNALIFFCKDRDIFRKCVHLVSKYPSPMRLWIGNKMLVVIQKPSQIEKIVTSAVFSAKEDALYKYLREYIGNGLISESGPKWKNDRKILSPLFSRKITRIFISKMVYHSKILTENLRSMSEKSSFNVKPIIQRSVCDLICETLLGVTTKAHTGMMDSFLQHINKAYIVAFSRMTKFWLQFDCIFKRTAHHKTQEEAKIVVHEFLRNAYKQNNDSYGKIGENDKSFLFEMLKLREVVPNYANEQDFVYHLTTFYTASEDTITIISSFALLLFGLFPTIQQRAYKEIVSILSTKDTIDENDIEQMTYLDRCIKEVLRLFPIAPFIVRRTAEDYKLDDNLIIPEGCSVVLAIHNVHRDQKYWTTPNTFNPDHFLPEKVEERPKYAYLPFSAGLRGCLGKPFAIWALKVILATILMEFIVEANGKLNDYKLRADISVRLYDNNYPVRLRTRKLFSSS